MAMGGAHSLPAKEAGSRTGEFDRPWGFTACGYVPLTRAGTKNPERSFLPRLSGEGMHDLNVVEALARYPDRGALSECHLCR